MRNAIIVVLVLTTVVLGYVTAKNTFRMSLAGLQGKTETITRGDLTLPINATGAIRPARRVEIKSEASGEVIEIARRGGDRVRAGDLLVRLQPDDEQRSVDRAQLDVDAANAKLEETRIALRQARTADLHSAQAKVDQMAQLARHAKYRMDKLSKLPEFQTNADELVERETTYRSQLAQLEGAKAALERARLAIPLAEQRVSQADATYEVVKTNLADAKKRLAKTDVVSPIDGIVGEIRTQIGEVIQGGKTTLTGGTVLAVVLAVDKLIVRAEADEADIGRVLALAPAWAVPGHADADRPPDDFVEAAKSMRHLPVITVESFRDEEFVGVVERIFPEPRNLQGVVTYLVDVVITSENRDRLLPGMRADVEFTSEHVSNVLLCPNEAIREGPGGKLGVHVPKSSADPDERATEFLVCTFGLDDGNYSEVKSGLEEGMTVYTKLPAKSPRKKARK